MQNENHNAARTASFDVLRKVLIEELGVRPSWIKGENTTINKDLGVAGVDGERFIRTLCRECGLNQVKVSAAIPQEYFGPELPLPILYWLWRRVRNRNEEPAPLSIATVLDIIGDPQYRNPK